jgi:phosphoglycolate phosphatase
MICGMADHDAVLFDLDGVLVDSRVPFARGVNTALAAQGLPQRPERELHQYLGPPLHRTFQALVGEESLVQPCVDSYRERYRELAASETTVFPGIREILDELSLQLPLVIATSKPRALAEPLLESLDLRRFFTAVIGPKLDSENEQKAVTIARAMHEFSPDAHPVMVGDRKHDIAAAHEHDIPAIGVLWGIGSEEELLTAGADGLARTPTDLATLLVSRPPCADAVGSVSSSTHTSCDGLAARQSR